LRTPVRVAPGKSVRLAFSTGLAHSREGALALADQYHDLRVVQRAFELAWAEAQVELRHAHLSANKIHLFQRLGAMLLYPDFTKRSAAALVANRSGQPGLWRYGISGDYPILLARICDANQDNLVRELLLAHDSWRAKHFVVELVILNEHPAAYSDAVQDRLQRLLGESTAWSMVNKRGGIFILSGGRVPEEDRNLLQAAAHVVLIGKEGSLEKQLDLPLAADELPPLLAARKVSKVSPARQTSELTEQTSQPTRQYDNGWGGFTADGREYVIQLVGDRWTPAPWSNVIANAGFGSVVTEAGCGSTWAENSRENRLTSWSNDPISDPPSEAVYLRDEETGEVWSPTPLPIREATPYTCRHGQGYTKFEHISHSIDQQLLITIGVDDPLKILQLKLRNNSGRTRELSATFCVEWVLGVEREQTQLHVLTEIDQATGALLASNRFNVEFGARIAFLQLVGRPASYTADRREFFGRNGNWTQPEALNRAELSGRVGPGCDPCGAMQTKFRLGPGEQKEVVFLLGQAANREELERLLVEYKELPAIENSIRATQGQWDETLGQIQVSSPNPALDLLLNRWLLYQTLSCRFWGRTAFYQSGGAYGFRDQLQDSMALVYSRPDLAREHLLRGASRQFEEGDVQHWWHPPSGRGVRTRISDDLLWLPFVAAHYIEKTGDRAILDAPANYLRSPVLLPQEHERYEHPEISTKSESLYAHCVAALRHAEAVGAHALPLMGTGDWNDGMNEVGAGGRGESVWLAWFLSVVQERFAPLAEAQNDSALAAELRQRAKQLREAAEAAWDGAWYRRAYFDDGTPLGSAQNDACQIDSISQSWAVLAGGDRERASTAMEAVGKQLIEPDQKLVHLLWPPFDKTALEPGYIKGYLPGVRENGGQYTHAALWVVKAHARMGLGDRAMEIFDILNPIHHCQTDAEAEQYRTEPYVVAADVYSLPPHTGRGGWTWYTGSASWMYRVGLEDLLGFELHADVIKIDPCIPSHWPEFSIRYRRAATTYQIVVKNPERVSRGVRSVMLDDIERPTGDIPILADGHAHRVQVTLGTNEK
jgi:cyclic beta-1,2-glucan synthetase